MNTGQEVGRTTLVKAWCHPFGPIIVSTPNLSYKLSQPCEVPFQRRQTPPLPGTRLQSFSPHNVRFLGNSSSLGAIVSTEWQTKGETRVSLESPHSCQHGYPFTVVLTAEAVMSVLVDTHHPSWFLSGATPSSNPPPQPPWIIP